ncbi:unnamed protein product [Darwinula stevensoni]|uniref:Mitochondrial cardiolipin hydrolase n=1 Tax=Darwinula stevensoni TaxID=69355 RepID=A0A7R9FR41_9CRUS|nr:unnamed protein product [Darwinula stevensoni]CAG0900954.1 unnamed protein product [Darwinula stevensoni]
MSHFWYILGTWATYEFVRYFMKSALKLMISGTSEKQDTEEPNNLPNASEILFFPDQKFVLGFGDRIQPDDGEPSQNVVRMVEYLNKAESTLDVCMYILTHRNLCNALIEASYRGLKIRCIVDKKVASEGYGAGEMVGNLRRKGIAVRCFETTFLMHHKFVVIDKKIVMMGSFNWTMQAVCGNNDVVLISNHADIVNPFVEEFLWSCLNDATCSIDACLFVLASSEVGEALMRASARGVAVSILIDREMMSYQGSQAHNLLKLGIRIMSLATPLLLHHKFIIIDNRIVIDGSFNWTTKGLAGNFENAIATNDPNTVCLFVQQFQRIKRHIIDDCLHARKVHKGEGNVMTTEDFIPE